MTRLQFVQQMIGNLRTFLVSGEPVVSISSDGGGSVSYDRKGAWEMLKELEREERNLLNPNNWMRSIDLSQAF
jgi:hypothetical protein